MLGGGTPGRGRRGTGARSGTGPHSSSTAPMECGRLARWFTTGRGDIALVGRRGRRSACIGFGGVYGLKPSKSLSCCGCWRVSGAGGGGSSQRGQASASESGLRGGGGRGLAAPSVMAACAGSASHGATCVARGVRRSTAAATPASHLVALHRRTLCFGLSTIFHSFSFVWGRA